MNEDNTTVIGLGELRSPAPSRTATFIVIGGSGVGRMYKLTSQEMSIGRSADCEIQLEDEGVSRRHAKVVRRDDGSLEVFDLQSTNGTFCNGERVTSRVLQDGDKIQIGTTTILKFSIQDNVEEEFQRVQYEAAVRDALTGCYNKKYFLERLPSDVAFARRHNSILSLAMMDIDFFKNINDTYGHPAGDHTLRSVARTIMETIRADDVVARYGGEEFALIMRNTPSADAAAAGERIRRKLEQSVVLFEGNTIKVTISIGIASWTASGTDSPEALIGSADQQLYKAKHSGRNRVEVLAPT
jgi:two-component system, cell cycle response regulator